MKKFGLLLIFCAPLFVAAQKKSSEKQFNHSVELNTTPENAWNALVDCSNIKLWDKQVIAVKCPMELKANQRCQTILEGGTILEIEIEDIVENESYTLRYKLSSGNIYIQRNLVKENTLVLEEKVWYKGLSKKTFERYKGDDYQDVVENRMENFKKYIENNTVEGK
ncbi:MAG: hypothetical protein AAF554_09325 [Bacteroidota bacterium]